jgi:thymidylate synthase (FAD)
MTIALKNPNHYSFAERFASNAWRSEEAYLAAIETGVKPQDARDLLINATKTEVVMTANLREWRHFFELRCDQAAHPDMRKLAQQLLIEVHRQIPVIFDDLYYKFIKEA